jgi:carbon-monoxide dehydrogenase large subunit
VPHLELDRTVTPSPRNPLGAKGVGEAGTVGTPAAIANAVVDALRPLGVDNVDLPITAEQVWRLVHRPTRSGAGEAFGGHSWSPQNALS